MSWWASSAEEFRKQISLAVSPSQKLAAQTEDSLQTIGGTLFGSVTTLAEQSEASLRASADRAATSAQLLASQTDEGLQSLRGSILASANSFAEAVGEAMPLTARRATAEREVTAEEFAQRFESEAQLLSGALRGAVDGFMVTTTLGSTFKSWEERLASDTKDDSRELAMPALRALMRTSALKGVLEALMAAAPRQRVLRRAAEFAAASERESIDADAGPEEIAGEQLVKLLSLASVAPVNLQRDILSLLFSATEAADRCRGGALSPDGVAAEEDVRWLTQILSATLPDSREADTLAASRLCESVERVLAAANAVCQAKGVLVSCTPVPKPPSSLRLAAGAEVWACWPGNGCWYRAQLQGSMQKRDRLQVTWLRNNCGRGVANDEYLCYTGCDDTLFDELSSSSVMLVEETIRRPPPTPDDGYPAEQWESRLAAIESHGLHFNELRALSKQLESHRRWSQGESSTSSPTSASKEPDTEPPLAGAADTLQALRVEAQERAEALCFVASECADEQISAQEQIKTSTGAMASELQTLQTERAESDARAEHLRLRREELLEQLRLVNEELTTVEKTRVSLDLKEQHLQESMTRVAEELAQQVDRAKEHGVVAQKRQHVIEGSVDASRAVEEQLAKRCEAVVEATDTCNRLFSQEQLVGVTYLTSDRARCLELQELLNSWHECVWGPEAGLIPNDPERSSSLRQGHLTALHAVEDALREVEQSAMDSQSTLEGLLGFNGGETDDKSITLRHMNRAINSYKEMRQQLKENLERLAQVEAVVPGTSDIDPSITLARLSGAALCKPASPVKAADGENEDGI